VTVLKRDQINKTFSQKHADLSPCCSSI